MALRVTRRRERVGVRTARVDRRTKNLLRRVQPGEVAVIDHEDLDRVAAEELVAKGVSAVVNAAPSISGRYPNLGPLILVEAGIALVDTVGSLLLGKVHEGDVVRVDGDRVYVGDRLAGVGIRQSVSTLTSAMEAAQRRLADQFESFATNTLEFMARERDLLFGGAGLPDLDHNLSGRHVLVVVRGYHYKEDLAALRSYIRELRPILVGVDGGADALREEGYRPDVVLGDMDSVSERGLLSGAEIVLHAYRDGSAPGRERITVAIDALGGGGARLVYCIASGDRPVISGGIIMGRVSSVKIRLRQGSVVRSTTKARMKDTTKARAVDPLTNQAVSMRVSRKTPLA